MFSEGGERERGGWGSKLLRLMSLASLARSVRSVTWLRRFARYVTLRDYVIRRAHTPPGKNSV